MARDLDTGKISEPIIGNPDHFFYEEDIPTDDTANSAGLLVGKTQGSLEIVAKVSTAVEITDTARVRLVLQSSKDDGKDDAYADVTTLLDDTSDSNAEVITLTVDTAPDTDGDATISLRGADPVTVALLAADTDEQAAVKIGAETYPGWTTGVVGAVVTFTADDEEAKYGEPLVFDGGDTNAEATAVLTTEGTDISRYTAGTELLRYAVPTDGKLYWRIAMISTDATPTGAVSAFVEYISR